MPRIVRQYAPPEFAEGDKVEIKHQEQWYPAVVTWVYTTKTGRPIYNVRFNDRYHPKEVGCTAIRKPTL